ncbi:MAG: methyltransferase domain-containing protein [Planctomycetes bacterium]|nr:methyltransferase domain-containing protein [Planctomycetota bacterium]
MPLCDDGLIGSRGTDSDRLASLSPWRNPCRSADNSVSFQNRLRFLKEYVSDPSTVGALAPSSGALAQALCEPFRRFQRPARVLEVGAGTGAVTRHLGALLGEKDELDICEIQPRFADILRRDVLSRPEFADSVRSGRVRLLVQPVQEIANENHYDFIISGLPLTAFDLQLVEEVFDSFRRCLKRTGVLSYFEYMAMRRTSRTFSVGRFRKRVRSVSRYLTARIREHQFARRTVLRNFPPAYARHLKFDSQEVPVGSKADPAG